MNQRLLLKSWTVKLFVVLLLVVTSLGTPLSAVQAESSQALQVAEKTKHPLDPVTAEEVTAAIEILKAKGYTDAETYFPEVRLYEPPKADVWNWKSGKKFDRQLFLVVRKDVQVYETVVNITTKQVVSWQEMKGVQSGVLMVEWATAQEAVMADPGWQTMMKQRGITDYSKVACIPLSVGYYGEQEYAGKRLVKVPCFLKTDDGNPWSHPIEGVTPIVDLQAKKVFKITDTGVLPIPSTNNSLHEPAVKKLREGLKPRLELQPFGYSYKISGNMISWQNWNFHFRMETREGPVLSTVTFNDGEKDRHVMYRGSLAGLLVPYGDPDPNWYFRAFMDEGEYGIGKLLASQIKGIDAPANASYLDVTLPDETGSSYVLPNAFSLFERSESPEWRHYESFTGITDGRERRELVLRAVATLGNYDYIFDWVFEQNGTIRIDVGATGLPEIKAVKSKTLQDDVSGQDTKHGTLVEEHAVATNHQHLYNFRLDLDVDGMENSFMRLEPRAEAVNRTDSPRKSGMVTDTRYFKNELDARLKFDPTLIPLAYNPNVTNKHGYNTSYQVIPAATGTHPFAKELLMTPDDWLQKRAGFTAYHLWTTNYNPKERYPEGDYPNQGRTEQGLGKFVEDNSSIQNTDNVTWVTTGTTHIVRAEEFPVMPTEWVSVMLKPWNFFDKTPTLDLPK